MGLGAIAQLGERLLCNRPAGPDSLGIRQGFWAPVDDADTAGLGAIRLGLGSRLRLLPIGGGDEDDE